MPDFATLRRNMVDCQLRIYDVTDRGVLAAFDKVPREVFFPPAAADLAYLDQIVPYSGWGAPGRAGLAPMVLARMIQSLRLAPGDRVLDYAGGAGYSAAILAELGAEVTLFEPAQELAAKAGPALAEAGAGAVTIASSLPAGPFEAILVNGSFERDPDELMALLAEGGRLVGVRGQGRAGRVMLFTRSSGVVSGRAVFDAAAPLLPEFERPPAFVF